MIDLGRRCDWCGGTISPKVRRDAITCSQSCRQARHRFTSAVGVPLVAERSLTPLRLAYADPPYPGKARYYRGHPDFAGEVDHRALIGRLVATYDGWALSTSAEALPEVLSFCPPVCAWRPGYAVSDQPVARGRSTRGSR